ncbi:MAG: hypothetical protein ABS54_03330 [Hyphomicrobium sp. SCN 65-11]|nr:MAG: hypothetical protein ABS54_03330 [Hyphomicrobium sp. SCN 65-11]
MSPRVVVEQVIRSWSTQDVESTLAHCGDDVVYSVNIAAEAAPFAGTSEGKDAVRAALHDAALILASHHLVNLRHETSSTHRERDGDTYRVAARFRAVLEPNA